MEILNICNTDLNSLFKIRTCEFNKYFNEIDDRNIIQLIVEKQKEIASNLGNQITTEFDITLIYFNKDNQKIKRVTKIKQTKNITKISKRVLERQKTLKKFGNALKSNSGYTMIGENVDIKPLNEKEENNSQNLDNLVNKKIINENPKMKFSDRKKLKNYKTSTNKISEPPKEPQNTKYQSPYKRNKTNNKKQNKYTVHISGFIPEFNKNDFINLIPKNIKYDKVYLPINEINNESKGFGFIDVNNENDLKLALDFFDGKPYNHMILRANIKK